MKMLLALSLVLLFAACKFESPITEKPTRDVDPALVGNWFSTEDGNPREIYRLSGKEYLVVDHGTPYVCTHSDVNGVAFISCRQIKNDPDSYGKYAYIGYRLEGAELILIPLNDKIGIKEHLSTPQIRGIINQASKAGTALDPDPAHELHYKKVSQSHS